jgi:hypothetical protein
MKTNDALKQSRRRFLQTAGAAAASLALGGCRSQRARRQEK